jgi:soluble lytic murein transglycosylase-like protein
MRICFILASVIIATGAVSSAASTNSPATVTLIVKSDARTGRLVRGVARPASTFTRKTDPQIELPASTEAPAAFASLVDRISEKHDVDRDLVNSVIRVESNYNPLAISNKGALGLMQLIPSTARRFGVSNSFNPAENVEGGVRYLKYLLEHYNGDHHLALAAYNAGEGTVERYGGVPPFAETRSYVYRVGKALDQRKEAKRQHLPEASPAKSSDGFNHVRAFKDATGQIYYKTP